ncbi:hypothetical protein GH714_016813 [Hevea brasiliensis]|uniref:Glycosyltransferase family 92 protein n=1 Tax=Hevea brasiliensis TaxID=3981 RepID=A0A6A6NHZ2_HEVBR|nr:hypothetical protein GH714_016813 [Hevea brasiliensis]
MAGSRHHLAGRGPFAAFRREFHLSLCQQRHCSCQILWNLVFHEPNYFQVYSSQKHTASIAFRGSNVDGIIGEGIARSLAVFPPQELLRWTYLVYQSFSTVDDVVLFVKGPNNRQGINSLLANSSACSSTRPSSKPLKPPLRAQYKRCSGPKKVVPSVVLHPSGQDSKRTAKIPTVRLHHGLQRGKVLERMDHVPFKDWREKFILYDNDSDDDLISVVNDLNQEGYNVETLLWTWPKTQEAGFSHAAVYAKDSCNWMMYIDVDEFVFAPSWDNSTQPSDQMLKSLLPSSSHGHRHMIGEVSIMCNEFGPSQQRSHPEEGVTQGYTCRRKVENRHKSIVLLEAIDDSLLNVIHHFSLKKSYRMKHLSLEAAVVNHYKYQAWLEFKAKFRRRVSAYVVDWMSALNPLSKDRTPGLGTKQWSHKGGKTSSVR